MDREKVNALAEAAKKALAGVADIARCEVRYRGGTHTVTSCTLKFEFAETDPKGIAQTQSAEAFKGLVGFYGLKPEDLGRTFLFRNHQYKIIGLAPKAAKYPIEAERVIDKRVFRFPVNYVLTCLRTYPSGKPEGTV